MNRLAKGLLFAAAAGGGFYGLEAAHVFSPDMFVGSDHLTNLHDLVQGAPDQFKDVAQLLKPEDAAKLGGDWFAHAIDPNNALAIHQGVPFPAMASAPVGYGEYFVKPVDVSLDKLGTSVVEALKAQNLIDPAKAGDAVKAAGQALQSGSDLIGKTAYEHDMFLGRVVAPSAVAAAGGALGLSIGGGQAAAGSQLSRVIEQRRAALANLNSGLRQNGLA